MLNRDCLDHLSEWCDRDHGRKPLLIRGARQVGKTTLVRMLAKRHDLHLVEINMEKPWRFTTTLSDLDVRRTIEAIEFELNIDIEPEKSIVFFDEVQACPSALQLMRYLHEEAPQYRVVATGSLLEFVLAEPEFSLPVGRIELFHLAPMTFREFLLGIGEAKAAALVDAFRIGESVSKPTHDKLNYLVRLFCIVGGMPEVVAAFAESRSLREVERIKSGIVETFRLDFNKYRGKSNPHLLTIVYDALPRLMGRKLIYSRIDQRYRSGDLAKAVEQLRMAGVVTKVFNVSGNGVPLAAEKNDRFFKMLHLDTGLLLTQLRLVPTEIDRVRELNLVNDGTLAEQFVGQHLLQINPAYMPPELYYWAREKRASSAEVDFVVVDGSHTVVPVEVKAGSTGSLRSLQLMVLEKSLPRALRINSAPPSIFHERRNTAKGDVEFELLSLPHYLVQRIPSLLAE